MKIDGRILNDSSKRTIVFLVVALLLSTFLPVSMALIEGDGGSVVVLADISPGLPDTTDNLVCTVNGRNLGKGVNSFACVYSWYKNDVLQPDLTGDTVDARHTAKGEVWKCVLRASKGVAEYTSQDAVTIHNSAPSAPVADITPDLPHVADDLICSIRVPSLDADGDNITYTYAWYDDGELQPQLTGDVVDAAGNARGQAWRCLVTATDGSGGRAGSFDEVTIDSGNSAPSVPTINLNPRLPVSADDLVCSIVGPSTDPDRDPVTYSYAWYKDDVLQSDLTGSSVGSTSIARGERWKVLVVANDGHGASAGEFCESTIHNSPPTAPVVDVTPDVPAATDPLVCTIVLPSSDSDGDVVTYTYAWYKNGVLQPQLSGSTVDASYAGEGLTWRCVVTASDGVGGSASSYDEVGTPPTALDPGMVNTLWTYGVGWRYLTEQSNSVYEYRSKFIADCQDFGINTWQCQIDQTVFAKLYEEPDTVVAGIQAFNAAGIQVWACWNDGIHTGPGWEDEVDGHTWHEFCDAVLKWNKDHPTARFTALAFDLECPNGSTDEQHRTHLEGIHATMQTMRAHTVDGTETIKSQGLPVVILSQPRWSNSVIASAFSQVVSNADVVQIDHYRWGGEGYSYGIQRSVGINSGIQTIVDSLGRYFTVSMSCDELPKNAELGNDPYGSRFNFGRAQYEADQEEYAEYFSVSHPGNFRGLDTYFDVGGFSYWYLISGVNSYAAGTKAPGDVISISYTTRRLTDRYMHRIFGVQMELKDSTGAITKTNQIIDCIDGQVANRTISLTIPGGAAGGAAEVRLTMWAVGWYDDNYYDKLYYGDYAGYSSELLAMTMDQLGAATTGPNGVLEGKRPSFFILQDMGWQGGVTVGVV